MASTELKLKRLSTDCVLTVEVLVTRQFRIRMWIALKLITFAWWLTGGRVEIRHKH